MTECDSASLTTSEGGGGTAPGLTYRPPKYKIFLWVTDFNDEASSVCQCKVVGIPYRFNQLTSRPTPTPATTGGWNWPQLRTRSP